MTAEVFYELAIAALHVVVFFMGFQSGMHR